MKRHTVESKGGELYCECGHHHKHHRTRGAHSCRKCDCKAFKVGEKQPDDPHSPDCGCPMCRLARLERTVQSHNRFINLLLRTAEVDEARKQGEKICEQCGHHSLTLDDWPKEMDENEKEEIVEKIICPSCKTPYEEPKDVPVQDIGKQES